MRIRVNRQSFTKRSILFVCFFASMFLFASFTKEDRQKVRSFKLRMMDKYVHHSTTEDNADTDSTRSLKEMNNNEYLPETKSKTYRDGVQSALSNIAFPENTLDNTFASEEKQGTIGEFSNDESDNVSDNFFTITIPEIKRQNIKAYLMYDLFGLESYHSVSRSINKNVAFGGNIIVASSKWSTQKEEIALNSLEKGKNTILFTSSLNGVKYKVKNVKIVFENNLKSSDNISSLLSGNNLYIKGIENGPVNIKGKSVSSLKGEYETLVELTDADKAQGFISIASSNGVREYKIPENKSSFKTLSEEKFTPLTVNISKDKEFKEVYENSIIAIEKNSVRNIAQVQVLKLRKKDYPAISREIKNMTVNSSAYRLENRSGEFTKNMVFSFPYDEKKLGARSAKELKAFYFDYASKKWKVDPTSKVDTEKKIVTVETKGDTDYINGVISVPESSQLEAFAPTSISGLKAADPTAGLQLMGVPTATQKGDASASYPIRVPAGLGGLQPSLSIGYNSAGGNGWMGDGWNVNGLSAITVDTRWGTPVFDTKNGGTETELYSLDGEMLVYPNGYLPHRHNDVNENNTAITTEKQKRSDYTNPSDGTKKQFYLRKNHDFTLIERIGTAPDNYTWKVTSTDGTKRYYGGSTDSMLSGSGGVVHWGLRVVEDVHGNTMRFTYYNEFASGAFFQIKKIEYGKNYDYSVNFNKETSVTRQDININAKQGVARSEAFLLKSIEVKYKTELVRTYKMDYIEGEFYKTLLKRIYIVPNNPCSTTLAKATGESKNFEEHTSVTGKASGIRIDDGTGGNGGGNGGIEPTCNEISDSYTFDYYNDVKDGSGNVKIFGPDTAINFQNDHEDEPYSDFVTSLIKPSKINGNISTETGLNIRIAAGLNFYTPSSAAYGHLMFGFPFGNSTAKARNAQQLIDFNGDGIQDMIYRNPNKGLLLRSGKLDDQGKLSFSESQRIENYSGGDFSYTETKTRNRGWDMGAIIYSKSETDSKTNSSTKTYLIDANSDGLMDIVHDGEVWFNRFDTGAGKSFMSRHSEYTENMVVKAKAIQPPIKWCGDIGSVPDPCPGEPEPDPMDVGDIVKVWIAPRDGYVKFTDNVSISPTLVSNPSISLSDQMYYGVEIKNPTPQAGIVPVSYANTRIYLKQLLSTDPPQNIVISRYNDYYTQMQSVPVDPNYGIPNGIDNPDRLFVKSGEKIYVRLHKNKVKNVEVTSNPTITYVDQVTGNEIPNTFELSQDQFQLNNGNYETNFLLNNAIAPILLDAPGTVTINVLPFTLSDLSDDIKFRIVTENVNTGAITPLITPEIYTPSNLTTQAHTINLTVHNGEKFYLRFIVESDSFTNYVATNWSEKIYVDYHASVAYSPTPIYIGFLGIPEYPSFVVTQLQPKLDIYAVPHSGFFNEPHDFSIQINKNITNFATLSTGSFYYIIKKGNQVLAKRRVLVSPGNNSNSALIEQNMIDDSNISGLSPITFFTGNPTFGSLGNDHLVTVEVYCKTGGDYELFNKYSNYFAGKPFNIYYDGATVYGTTTATALNTAMYNTKSMFFNNWGQFLYKPGAYDNYLYGKPISLSEFATPTTPQNTYSTCLNIPDLQNNYDALADCILATTPDPNAGNNTASQVISPLKPQIIRYGREKIERWIGSGPEQYSSGEAFKTDDEVTYFTDPVPTVPLVTPTTYTSGQLSVDTSMKAISRDQRSNSHNKTVGGTLWVASVGNSETTLNEPSIETQTFSDMNGDGYPDMVYPSSMQLTNSTGSLEDIQLVSYSDYPTSSLSYMKSNSAGFSYNSPPVTGRIGAHGNNGTSTQPDTGMPWSGSASLGASLNQYYNSYDAGSGFWMDVNGDGLPDRVRGGNTSYMTVALNLGKSLGANATYQNMITYKSHPKASASISLGAGLGSSANLGALSSFGFGINAGVSAGASTGTADVVYEDVNSDGLIDILEVASNGATTVRYNLGNRFATGAPLMKSGGDIDFADETRSFNGSFSFGGDYMFSMGPITLIPPVIALVLWIKAGAGATVNLGMNVSETRKAFKDMNGDGFTDLVQDTNSGFIVNYSQVGRTNKLKSITNTFSKGTYILDYKLARANYDNPHAKFVIKSISILEPDVFSAKYTTDQGTKMETTYEFRNRKYDRREREDFGFDTVITQEMNNGSAVRTTTDKYFNNSYLLNGILNQTTVVGGGSTLSDVKYNYKLRKFMSNATLINLNSNLAFNYDSGGTEGRKMAIALLDEKIKTTYESGGSIVTTEKFTYTTKGLISKYQYTSPSASYNSNITYQALNNNIIGVPTLIEVYDGTANSQLLRRRKAYNINFNNGNVGSIAIFDGTNESVTDIEYNNIGNVTKVTYPPSNSNTGPRYWIGYTYDDAVTGKYVVEVKDVFDIKSTAIYNPLFDVATRKVDTGGNAMVFTYDGFGRTRTIMGPNEIASGSTVPTVKYKYWLDHAGIANNDATVKIYRASTSNFDPEYAGSNNTIMTDSYSDFLGRIVQVKKDIEMYGYESRSISGRAVFDGLGRIVRQYHPTFEGLANQNLNSSSLSGPYMSSVYDSRDRVVSATDEDNVVTTTVYSIDSNLFKTTQEISNEKSESYANAEGKIVQKDDYLDNDPLSTLFEYNTIGELVRVTDPEGISTQYSYDLAGRRLQQVHPDKGTTRYEYDPAGNLIKFTTDNLLNDPSIGTNYIFYKYQYNRLVEIALPDLPSGDPNPNNVVYQYAPYTAGNNAGKLIYKEDGSGNVKYTYGRMGEMLTELKTVRGYGIPETYYKTIFNHDSWNRITKIKYPDDEIVSYHYDKGGNLKSVDNDQGETYIQNITYDNYEQRTNIVYGNGTSQNYSYDPQNRKLVNYNLNSSTGNPMLQNVYRYDEFSNITGIKNMASPLANGMGGAFEFEFRYDTLNRLIGTGTRDVILDGENQPIINSNFAHSTYSLRVDYNKVGGIVTKNQHHERDLTVVPENTYINDYIYAGNTHKLDKVVDGLTGNTESFEYDYNGNTVMHNDINGTRKIFWDEQDRMKAFYNDNTGVYQYHTYDDKGERVIRYGLEAPAQLYQNGAPVVAGDIKMVDYKLYPNPYVTVSSTGQYTKHYFEGSKRFASRLLDGAVRFEDPSILYSSKMADQKTPERKADAEADFKKYLEKTDLGNNVSVELREVMQRPNLYYLHGDHLGTATFVTNSQGEATQFFLNLPFGETMLEQMDGSYNNPYKFNAKELDEDTGLYYYGARYYNPRLSIWYGVDPLAEKYPSWSPYAYCGNNPINYIDPDGNFRLPANATRMERRLYNEAIKTIKAVFRDSEFRKAFKDRFKVDDKMIQKMLKDGDGPTIIMNERILDLAHFKSDEDANVIKIDSHLVNTVSQHKGDRKYIDNLAEMIIHEGGHWADYAFDHISEEFTTGFRTGLHSKSGRPDAGDNWELIYFGTDTQFSASDRDIITEKFDGIRMNNFRKNFRQQIEIRDLKSQKMPSVLDNYKKPKDNLRVRPCY